MKTNKFLNLIQKILGKFRKKSTINKYSQNGSSSTNGNFGASIGNSAPRKMENSYSEKTKNFSGFDDFDPSNFK